MNRSFFTTFAIAATLFVAGTARAVENDHFKVNVNFPFKASSKAMPAGDYKVEINNASGIVYMHFRNLQTGSAAVLVAHHPIESAKPAAPRLVFTCGESECGLTQLWNTGQSGWATPKPKLTPAEKERTIALNLERVAGE